jgi:hypothetical protein
MRRVFVMALALLLPACAEVQMGTAEAERMVARVSPADPISIIYRDDESNERGAKQRQVLAVVLRRLFQRQRPIRKKNRRPEQQLPRPWPDLAWLSNYAGDRPADRSAGNYGAHLIFALDIRYLPKAASSKCASRTPAFCNRSRTIGTFATT